MSLAGVPRRVSCVPHHDLSGDDTWNPATQFPGARIATGRSLSMTVGKWPPRRELFCVAVTAERTRPLRVTSLRRQRNSFISVTTNCTRGRRQRMPPKSQPGAVRIQQPSVFRWNSPLQRVPLNQFLFQEQHNEQPGLEANQTRQRHRQWIWRIRNRRRIWRRIWRRFRW